MVETNRISNQQFLITMIYIFSLIGFSDIPKFLPVFYLITICYVGICGLVPMARTKKIRKNSAESYYLILILWVMFSGIWQSYQSYYSQRIITMLMIVISTIPLAYMIKSKERFINTIDAIIYGGISAVLFRLLFLGGVSIEGSNGFAISCTVLFSMCMIRYLDCKKKQYLLFMFLIVPLILFTASRRAIIYIIIEYVIIIFTSGQKILKKIVISVLLALIAIYIISTLPVFSYLKTRLLVTINPSAYNTKDYSTMYRQMLIEAGWAAFKKNPVLGYGVGYSFEKISYSVYKAKTYLHNNYLELMVGLGAIGTMLYYCIYVHILKYAFKCANKLIRSFIVGIIVLFIFADVGSVTYYDKFSIWILMLLSFGGIIYGRDNSINADI